MAPLESKDEFGVRTSKIVAFLLHLSMKTVVAIKQCERVTEEARREREQLLPKDLLDDVCPDKSHTS